MTATPTKLSLMQYSFIALPLAFAGLPLYIHAPDFYTRDLGLSIGVIGMILLVIRLFDAVQDPLIGYISDKYAPHRMKIMVAGVLLLALGMGAVFSEPLFQSHAVTWFAASMILATSGFSIIAINLSLIGGFWSDNTHERTRISSWREGFTLTGLLIGSILPTIFLMSYDAKASYLLLYFVFLGMLVAGLLAFIAFSRKIKIDFKTTKAQSFSFFKVLLGTQKHFFCISFLTHIAAAFPGVLVLFFIKDYLNAENYVGLFLFLYFISGAALMPLWVKISKIIGKYRAWGAGMVLSIITFIGAFFLQEGDIIAFAIVCILSGTALGADLALPPSILADRINDEHDENNGTQYYAALSLLPKFAVALASGASFMILDSLTFTAGADNSTQSLQGLIILYALVPCIIKLIAAIYLWFGLIQQKGKTNDDYKRTVHHGVD